MQLFGGVRNPTCHRGVLHGVCSLKLTDGGKFVVGDRGA